MVKITDSVAVSILFTETGCLINSKDLKPQHKQEIEFLIHGEEVGDFNMSQFHSGMNLVRNKIMMDAGLIKKPYHVQDVIMFKNEMMPIMKSQWN
jgi:hypothetical protein